MRIIIVSLCSIFVVFLCFWIVKLWGQSQVFPEYKHPMYSISSSEPIEFIKPSYAHLEKEIQEKTFLFLDVAITLDQKLVAPKRLWSQKEKSIQYLNYDEIKNDALLLQNYKEILKKKKIIFNLIENSQAAHENFFYNMQQLDLEKGDNFIVTSPYEAPIKALKDLAPSFLFATTQPEILKILAMGSMYLYEAVNIRADLILHPLKIRNQGFFTEDFLKELRRRRKRIIVGPISEAEKTEAVKLSPYGLVIQEN